MKRFLMLLMLLPAPAAGVIRGRARNGKVFKTWVDTEQYGRKLHRGYNALLDEVTLRTPCRGPQLKLLKESVELPEWARPVNSRGRILSDNLYSAMVKKRCRGRLDNSERRLVVEVGSLDGLQAIEAVRAGCMVKALEPSPANFNRTLLERSKAGITSTRMRVYNKAAASSSGSAVFRATLQHKKGSEDIGAFNGIVAGRSMGGSLFGRDLVTVRTERLDSLLARHGTIELLKIDVQGWEWGVLDGAEGVLANVKKVLVEVSPVLTQMATGQFDVQRTVDRLESLASKGWELYIVDLVSFFHMYRLPDPPLCASVFLEFLASSSRTNETGGGSGWETSHGIWADMLFVNPRWGWGRGKRGRK
eukprot:Hpha_TRINITY_DN16303_c2_g23::TRINITY_DN16303_c2_g23_i1::g.61868::m.61868